MAKITNRERAVEQEAMRANRIDAREAAYEAVRALDAFGDRLMVLASRAIVLDDETTRLLAKAARGQVQLMSAAVEALRRNAL